MSRRVLSTVLAVLFISVASHAQNQVPEIPVYGLGDIARVVLDDGRPVIQYDPILCQQIGPALCGFYRTHEYGHISLGHAIVGTFPRQAEAEADCWAAKNAHPGEVMAAYQFFMAGGGSTPIHGTGPERAARVRACAEGHVALPEQPHAGILCCTQFSTCRLATPLQMGSWCGCPSQFGPQSRLVCN